MRALPTCRQKSNILKQLGRGYSQMLGEKVQFKSIEDYQNKMLTLYQTIKGSKAKYGVNITEVGKSMAGLQTRLTGPEALIGSIEQHEEFTTMDTLVKKVMEGEGIGKSEMQYAYNVFQRGMEATSHMLGSDREKGFKNYLGRVGYYTYQPAVDKQIFSPGMRGIIGLSQQYTIGRRKITDTLDPDLLANGDTDEMAFSGHGRLSLSHAMIRNVLTAHEFRGGGLNAAWVNDVARSLTGNRDDAETIAQVIKSDAVLGPLMDKWTKAGVTDRVNLEESLQAALDSRSDELAQDLLSLVWGDDSRKFATGGGALSSMMFGRIVERGDRYNQRSSRVPAVP